MAAERLALMNDEMRLRDGLMRARRAAGCGRRWPERAVRAQASSRDAVYAALDLGTNNCRLLVATPTADSFRVIDSFSRIIRLGEGVSADRPDQRGRDRRARRARLASAATRSRCVMPRGCD